MALTHGGNVGEAAARYHIPRAQWIDLSTGISPFSWTVPPVPDSVWRNLPEERDGLEAAAAEYFGCDEQVLLPVPGSQYAIQQLPTFFAQSAVALPQRGYAEHAHAWRSVGHHCHFYRNLAELLDLVSQGRVEHAVVINPNNPTAACANRDSLIEVQNLLHQGCGGFLIVDEAFVDTTPQRSLAGECPAPGLLILRSLGKFFGLAGLRLGFVLAQPSLLERMQAAMSPWAVSHPARWVAQQALRDQQWVASQRERLVRCALDWREALREFIPQLDYSDTALFVTGEGDPQACVAIHDALCRQGILVRLLDEVQGNGMLRFGLPHPKARNRVFAALRDLSEVT